MLDHLGRDWGATDVGRMAHPSARISWIVPCGKRLERASNYPVEGSDLYTCVI
ncbi:hypothetical protein U1872_18340 [Sphingomonas sp. RB3P16]|uniref:hypothetical protein n=1 Tax=Parasphingomonas frigoris TaxID=3096163 RepID=UPI002FC6C1D2